MQFLKRLVITLFIAAAVLAAVSMLLPREVVVARSINIDAPPSAVFPYINDLKKMNEWNPWAKADPNIKNTYEGPDSGVGQKVSWQSDNDKVGTGSQEITHSVENQSVRTALDFGDHGTANASLTLVPQGSGTKVTWGFSHDTGYSPICRYMGLMMDSWIGEKYVEGLTDLKKQVEANSG